MNEIGTQSIDGMLEEKMTDDIEETTAIDIELPKTKKRGGKRKVVDKDGNISYGFKADGTPKKQPGRKKGNKNK